MPVATIGGEDGRPAVVVDDPVAGEKAAADALKTTEGLKGMAAAPGPNVFEQKVAEQFNSIESKPAPLPPQPIEGPSSIAGDSAAATNAVPVALPLEPEDLITEEEDAPVAIQTAPPTSLENLVPKLEVGSKHEDESVSPTVSPIVEDVTATSSGTTTTSSSPPAATREVEEDLARMQEALFGAD
jgi:hypothetical protein